jgi:hypothetical protein
MIADSFVAVGTSHHICQDYVYAGEVNGKPLAIVSDGCSSAPHSDWGSRFLTTFLRKEIYQNPSQSLESIYRLVAKLSANQLLALDLPKEALRATLLSVSLEDNNFVAGIWGDGFIFARRRKDGVLVLIKREFTSGAPYYLQYDLENMQAFYKTEFPGKYTRTCITYENDTIMDHIVHEIDVGMQCCFEQFSLQEYDFVGVMTDGINSFKKSLVDTTSISQYDVKWDELAPVFLAFKSFAGEFVHRRMQRVLKDSIKQNITHYDDLGVAAIYAY